MSELRPINGITIVGPIPDELQKITLFAAGVVAKSHNKRPLNRLFGFWLRLQPAMPWNKRVSNQSLAFINDNKDRRARFPVAVRIHVRRA
jgi:hypothetical protein